MARGLSVVGLRRPGFGPFDLVLVPGECLAVTGHSGSGKSVLLRMIADLDPNEGEVWLDGVARQDLTAPLWRRRVTYFPAESGWWADGVGAHFADPPAPSDLAALGLLADALGWPVSRLSTGERQRLALLRGLAHRPGVLLLDEPSSGLDPDGTAGVERVIGARLREGAIALIASHDAGQVERLATRRLRIEAGRPTELTRERQP